MAYGIGSALKRGGKSVEKTVKSAGRSTEKQTRRAGRHLDKGVRKASGLEAGKTGVDLVKSLFPGDQEIEDSIPEPEDASPMPIADVEESRVARRRSRARRRGGRSSSILTGGESVG